MSIAIRQLGLADRALVEQLLDLVEPDWHDSPTSAASGATSFLADPRSFMFGAFDDAEAIGWLWGVHVRGPKGDQMTYVHELDVAEQHRRRGVATLLMNSAMAEAKRNSSARLWLITRSDNRAGRGLYRSLDGDEEERSYQRVVFEF